MTDGLRLEHVTDASALHALRDEWNGLLAVSATNSLFLRHEWIATWWDVFGSDFDLHVFLVRDGAGGLVAAAPLMTGAGPGRLRRRLRHLMVVGQQGETHAEHLDLLVRRDAVPEAVGLLARGLLEQTGPWDALFLERVPADSPNLAALERALGAAGLPVARVHAQASPYLPLPGSWAELLAAKSKNFRRQWKNSYNRLAAQGTVRLLLAGRDVGLDEAFDRLVELHRARWGDDDGSFRTPRYVEFHRRLSRALGDAGDLLLVLLEVAGETVAARYDFAHGGKAWCFQSGWLPEVERMRAGTVLTGLVLEHVIERGLTEYDFLSGEDDYKRRWATEERTLVDVEAFTDRPRARWYRRATRLRDALRRKR